MYFIRDILKNIFIVAPCTTRILPRTPQPVSRNVTHYAHLQSGAFPTTYPYTTRQALALFQSRYPNYLYIKIQLILAYFDILTIVF